jgi:agmatine deiminase
MTITMPPEWAPQDWLWIGFPVEPPDWLGLLDEVQTQIASLANAGAESGQQVRLVVTTEQCLLNLNRNPLFTRDVIEAKLRHDLGFDRVLWLGDGLLGDHTDGHVDNLARFVAPGVLAVPVASGADDPNRAIYDDARARARAFGLEIRDIPSPGRFGEEDAEPASFMNFVVTSRLVVVPTYGTPHDADGVAAIAACFPDRDTIGLPADAVLLGGGSFHCCSQQMPSLP